MFILGGFVGNESHFPWDFCSQLWKARMVGNDMPTTSSLPMSSLVYRSCVALTLKHGSQIYQSTYKGEGIIIMWVYLTSIQHKNLTYLTLLSILLKWPWVDYFKIFITNYSVISTKKRTSGAYYFRTFLLNRWEVLSLHLSLNFLTPKGWGRCYSSGSNTNVHKQTCSCLWESTQATCIDKHSSHLLLNGY